MMHPFELVAVPIRRRIVEILASGEHTAGLLADAIISEFAVSGPAVSHHLRMLRENEVVLYSKDLTTRIYRLSPAFLDQLDEHVAAYFDIWDQRYGWRYDTDPLPLRERRSTDRRIHRVHGNGYRRRRKAGPDPWERGGESTGPIN